ncbi:MAG: N,N-dimethylformamidase beta subunit family domain-containing protein [Pseudonocardiaceae bacterium]
MAFTHVFADGAVIYAITGDGSLLWYRDELRDGTNGPNAEHGWAPNSGHQIGLGWNIQPEQQLVGYAVPLSVAAGGDVEVMLSSLAPGLVTLQLHRLIERADGSVGEPAGDPTTIQVAEQPVPALAWQEGCGWQATTTLIINPASSSGLYSARVSAADGPATDVVFVVRPAADAAPAPVLVLANTNCWNAYNAWGGRSNYNVANTGITLSFHRPNPETAPDVRTADGWASNHLTAAEIWLLSWLEQQGHRYDVCSDADLHDGTVDLSGYRAFVMSTHPEYWSQQMAVRLGAYLDGGGHLLYLGGNAAFRTVEFSADGSAMTTGADESHWCAEAWSPDGPFPRTLLGVAYDITADGNYPSRYGFIVDEAGHRFFTGTGLAKGEVFATAGRNGGGACGWEVDSASAAFVGGPAAPGVQLLAHGELVTAAGYGGDIAYYDTSGGGFVLAIGSITATGGLGRDTRLDTLVINALTEAITPA